MVENPLHAAVHGGYRLDHISSTGPEAADVGLSRQLMAADLVERGDGLERGVRSVLLQNDRVALEVVVDRGLDIAGARVRQVPIGWRSATDIVAPWFVENSGFGPHRGFFGGLLKTGGLDHIGNPVRREVPDGRQVAGDYPMHGRISGIPAKLDRYGVVANGDRTLEAFVEGTVTQVAVFDEHLTLRRRISLRFGSSTIRVADQVTNHGLRSSTLAVLYHVNVGWPVLAPGAIVLLPKQFLGHDHPSHLSQVPVPSADGSSRAWFFGAGEENKARAGIANPRIDAAQSAGMMVSWDPSVLPSMLHWRMDMRAGNYVLAFEPSTALTSPAQDGSRFPKIEPGETKTLGVDIKLLHGQAEESLLEGA